MSVPSPASSADAALPLAAGGTSRIYWKFILGHRHAAQFHNLKESYLPAVRDRLIWVGRRIKRKGGDLLLAASAGVGNVEIDIATWPDWLPAKVRELIGNSDLIRPPRLAGLQASPRKRALRAQAQ
jgi:hypothetical protein